MKFNKWTLGLAAVGAVSMASAVRADETPHLDKLNTAVSSTVISGYVDVAAQWTAGDPGTTYANNQPVGVNAGKVDNFSLNSVTISLDKALDESPWASGYHIDVNAGTDQIDGMFNSQSTQSHLAVRQAYVTLRTPVGNGIDWKIGAFDGVTGYEGNSGYANPNYTRSYGYAINPASEVGLIGAYKVVDNVVVQLGLVNRENFGYSMGSGYATGLSSKSYIATVGFTAPESFGFLNGSVLNLQTIQTFDNGGQNNYSVNATIATPVTGLKFGVVYDKIQSLSAQGADGNVFGLYATYQATDKLGFNLRGEYVDGQNFGFFAGNSNGEELTATIQYDLWANVVSRLEARWDHSECGVAFNDNQSNGSASVQDAFLLALNIVYKF